MGIHVHMHMYVCVCCMYIHCMCMDVYLYVYVKLYICIYIVSDYFEIGTVTQAPGVSTVVAFFIGITFNIGFC
jgi:hypothetical protein